ncbi:MAG: diguanylate cyclase [Sulfurospirillaceae bacterium]|nr:diguanylate cyclase [Sulfurospirillaceae bacterium]
MAKEKILIVEDNKALSKLIAKKMEANPHFQVDVAYTLAMVQELLDAGNDYFIALLDLNLPDAPNGEIVDYMIEQRVPSIVLTGTMDESVRNTILKKNIIDYVFKGNVDDVNYIFSLIERLYKNRNIKILVVDDSMVTRGQIKEMLKQHMFHVLVAAHGEEALVFLEDNPDIKLILTDYTMPVINGVELTKEVRKKYNKNDLSIIAMTASSEELVAAKFLKIGANDFINKPFTKEGLTCRINNSLDALEYIAKLKEMAHNDFLTGIYNRRYFFEEAFSYFQEAKKNKESFAIALIDIDDFKNINDTYGHDVGDKVLKNLAETLKNSLKSGDVVARFGGEEFSVILKNCTQKHALEYFIKQVNAISKQPFFIENGKKFNFSVSIGVAFEDATSFDAMLKQADIALYSAKKNGKNRVEVA